MIHEVPASNRYPETTFSISSGGVWMPGMYADPRAANYAFRFTDAQLIALRDRISNSGERRPVTWDDLKAERQAQQAK